MYSIISIHPQQISHTVLSPTTNPTPYHPIHNAPPVPPSLTMNPPYHPIHSPPPFSPLIVPCLSPANDERPFPLDSMRYSNNHSQSSLGQSNFRNLSYDQSTGKAIRLLATLGNIINPPYCQPILLTHRLVRFDAPSYLSITWTLTLTHLLIIA